MSTESKLKLLVSRWTKAKKKWEQSMLKDRGMLSSSRYEGISTGTRWCLEDLQKLFPKLKPKAKP